MGGGFVCVVPARQPFPRSMSVMGIFRQLTSSGSVNSFRSELSILLTFELV
jgi:hypothetical protein